MTLATFEARAAAEATARAPTLSPALARSLVLAAILAGTVGGILATDPATTARAVAHAGADLTRLLRAMAAMKAGMAVAAAAAVLWRMGSPASPGRLAAYATACATMAAGPGLIWDMARLEAGAILLHAGLLATIVMIWRDPTVSARLAAALAARRAARS